MVALHCAAECFMSAWHFSIPRIWRISAKGYAELVLGEFVSIFCVGFHFIEAKGDDGFASLRFLYGERARFAHDEACIYGMRGVIRLRLEK